MATRTPNPNPPHLFQITDLVQRSPICCRSIVAGVGAARAEAELDIRVPLEELWCQHQQARGRWFQSTPGRLVHLLAIPRPLPQLAADGAVILRCQLLVQPIYSVHKGDIVAANPAPSSAAKQRAIYFANLAACNIKTQQYAAAVQSCTEAIALDGGYEKAYMRRSEAFEKLDELDHALADAKKLLELAPANAWAKAKVAALQPVVDERTEKLKTEMFGKLKDLGNSLLGKFGLSTDNFKFDKDPNTGSYSIRFER